MLQQENDIKTDSVPIKAHHTVHRREFHIVSNNFINRTDISAEAKFLLIYLTAQAPTFVFHDWKIREMMGCGVNKLKDLFSELRKTGYVKTVAKQSATGAFIGSERVFAADPIFLLENQSGSKNESIDGEFKNRTVLKKDGPKTVLSYNNTNLANNTNLSFNNNKQKQEQPMVSTDDLVLVSFMKRLNRLSQDKNHHVSLKYLQKLATRHSTSYLEEKVAYVEKSSPDNPGGLFNVAIQQDFTLPEKKEAKRVFQTVQKHSRSSNEQLWDSFTDLQKMEFFDRAKKHFYALEDHMRLTKTDFLSPEFKKSPWFKDVMSFNGRPQE